MAALAVVLTATSGGYGYDRHELYRRMLTPARGYLDQPALTPLLARTIAAIVDQPWAMRVPATVICVATVLLVALITREVGGGARAQALAAWGYAFAAFPLTFGPGPAMRRGGLSGARAHHLPATSPSGPDEG